MMWILTRDSYGCDFSKSVTASIRGCVTAVGGQGVIWVSISLNPARFAKCRINFSEKKLRQCGSSSYVPSGKSVCAVSAPLILGLRLKY